MTKTLNKILLQCSKQCSLPSFFSHVAHPLALKLRSLRYTMPGLGETLILLLKQ